MAKEKHYSTSHKLNWVAAFLLLLLTSIIIYSNTFSSSFHFDDQDYIIDNLAIRNIRNLHGIWHFYPSRFISFLSFALNYHFFQLNVISYHLVNLIIHLTTAILAWWFVILVFSTPVMKISEISKYRDGIALFIALIFVSHPLQTESVTYIWQRTTSLAAFFYLFSLCLYIKTRLLQIKNNPFSKWGIFYLFSYLLAIVSMFTKENAATLCLIIILCEFCFFRVNKRTNWKYALSFLLMLPIVPLILFFAKPETFAFVQRLMKQPIHQGGSYFLTQLRVILTYIRLLFVPLNQNLDYNYPLIKNLMSPTALGSLLVLAIIVISAIRIFPRYRLLSFGIFWFFLTLLPESSIIPMDDVIFEHRLYLPLVGYAFFLVAGLYYLFQLKGNKFVPLALSLLVICYSTMTYQRNLVWKNEFSLWNDTVHKSPKKARPYNQRGIAYKKQGSLFQSISDYNKAIELNPNYAKALYNRGLAYLYQGNLTKAISDFDKAIEINPNLAEAYSNRGVAYTGENNYDRALSDFNKAIEINPNDADIYYNRAVLYLLIKEYDKAWRDVHRIEGLGQKVGHDLIEELKKASGRKN